MITVKVVSQVCHRFWLHSTGQRDEVAIRRGGELERMVRCPDPETCCAFVGVLEPLTTGKLRVHQAHRHTCLHVSFGSAAVSVILGQDCA